jgi:predicted DsbA family dithiol-disulfide isomerase
VIRLDIFSDPICPWCYIGKAGLDAALEARPGHDFAVAWHPFMLNPDMPPGGMDRRAYLEAKFGGRDGAVKAYLPVQQAAEAAGIAIDFSAQRRVPSTLDAHRLIHWAGMEGRQNAVVSALFRAYFTEGRDIGDPAVLVGIAGAAGLDAAMIARLLEGNGDADEIRARDAEIRTRGLSGVPAFVIAGRHVLHGAQPKEVWLRVIDELAGAA